MSSTWTTADLTALEAAIAKGVLEVQYTDKRIKYRSLNEMLQIRNEIKKCLGLIGKGGRLFAKHNKGLD